MTNVFWAAFGGGAAAGIFTLITIGFVEWLKWYLDRPLIRVKVAWAIIFDEAENQKRISISAINPHTKSVTLSRVGFLLKGTKGLQILKPDPSWIKLPLDVMGGKSYTAYFSGDELLSALHENGYESSDLRYAFFEAQSGKMYKTRLHKNFGTNLQKFVETNRPDSRV